MLAEIVNVYVLLRLHMTTYSLKVESLGYFIYQMSHQVSRHENCSLYLMFLVILLLLLYSYVKCNKM